MHSKTSQIFEQAFWCLSLLLEVIVVICVVVVVIVVVFGVLKVFKKLTLKRGEKTASE